ncbi:MAG: DUF1416 domain-containing protein [Actinomycetota bacterium]
MAKISGTVQKDGAPLERAYVRCVGPSGEFVAEEYTGSDGAFLFHVADGTWTLEVRAAGVDTKSEKVSADGDKELTISV